MGTLDDIRPLLYGARLFGCTPHRISDRELIVTKIGLLYSLLVAAIMGCLCIAGFYLISHDAIEFKMLFLTTIRTFFSYICFFTDGVITMIFNDRLSAALRRLNTFDDTTKFAERVNYKILITCHCLFTVVLIYWCFVGVLTYLCEENNVVFHGITYGVVNAAMSMQILKFVGILLLVYQRLCHLDGLIVHRRVESVSIIHHDPRYLSLQNIWWQHYCLTTAATDINGVYSTQLLFWIALMFLNGLSRLYTLTTAGYDLIYLKIRDTFSVIACFVNLLFIAATCHFTAAKANTIGKTTFSPGPLIQRRKNLIADDVEIAVYFYLRKLHFSAAAGFIRVNLPLLLSIAGAMTTYLVILDTMQSSNS